MNRQRSRNTPVLVIGYSRIRNIRYIVEKLIDFKVKNIYVAIDHSRNSEINRLQKHLVGELRNLASTNGCNIQVWLREKNHGVAAGIISALDWFFKMNKLGIVLEDDLEFEDSFLDFCEQGLESYKHEPEIWMISGNRFNAIHGDECVAATNYPQIWGWASWQERWIQMREAILAVKKIDARKLGNPAYCFFYVGSRRAQAGYIDTWDLPLAFEMYRQKKLCILPPDNLVSNVGTDVYSTHTTEVDFPLHFHISDLRYTSFPGVEDLRASIHEMNYFLEKEVFKIGMRHILSVPKFWMLNLLNMHSKKNGKSLVIKLREAESFEDY